MPFSRNLKIATRILKVIHIFPLLLNISCEKCPTEPEYSEFRIDISVDFVGATRVRLLVSISDSGEVREFGIKRNGDIVSRHQLSGRDTLITDVTANPATAYQYKGIIYYDGKEIDSSEVINLTTLDTTSHEVEWTIFRFGYIGSYLKDVFIVSEDDIWAVGFIETEETMHNDTLDPYNAVHWNGEEWKLKRIYYSDYVLAGQAVFGFNNTEVIVVAGGTFIWDGNSFLSLNTPIGIFTGSVTRLWGVDSDYFYYVGRNGNLVLYRDTIWSRININTALTINDIFGLSGNLIYMVGSNQDNWSSNFIIYEDGQIRNIDFPDTCMQAVYATAWNDVYLVGEGMLYYDGRQINDWPLPGEVPRNLLQSIRGNGPNDLFLAGHLGTIIHYNGKTWKFYRSVQDNYVLLGAIAVKNNRIVAVGTDGPQAYIYYGLKK